MDKAQKIMVSMYGVFLAVIGAVYGITVKRAKDRQKEINVEADRVLSEWAVSRKQREQADPVRIEAVLKDEDISESKSVFDGLVAEYFDIKSEDIVEYGIRVTNGELIPYAMFKTNATREEMFDLANDIRRIYEP